MKFPLSTLTLLLISAFSISTHAQERPPNLVIIFADDLGYGDLECYGHPTIRTPSLNRMAAEGTRFTQFYVAASVCTPSRAGLLTGRYPVRTGMVKGLIPGRVLFPNDKVGLPQREVTIAEILKQRDYATMAVGKWHLGHLPEFLPTAQGFDSYYGIPYSNDMDHVGARDGQSPFWNVPLLRDTSIIERPADQTTLTKRYTEEAIRFIRKNAERPFFLYLAHTMPHVPLFASPAFAGTSARGLYGDVVEEIDWSVGQVLDALEEAGIGDNTLVVFTSDNGPWLSQGANGGSAGLLREGKGMTWEGGMRVPMIAWWPEAVPAGETSYAFTTTLDLLPTAAALAGIMLPELLLDGYNILPVLKGTAPSPRDFFLFYRNDRIYAARYGPWKAHFFTQSEYPAGPLAAHEPPLLFHLENDPSERFDLAGAHPEVIEQIRKLTDEHRKTVENANQPAIEAETLAGRARVSGGRVRVQQMANFAGTWSGDAQLWWVEASPGDQLVLPMEAPKAGTYELVGFFTRAQDYGIVRLLVNGRPAGALMDGYGTGVEPTGPVSFGKVELKAGMNELTVELVGKDVRAGGHSDGYLVGIDGFLLR